MLTRAGCNKMLKTQVGRVSGFFTSSLMFLLYAKILRCFYLPQTAALGIPVIRLIYMFHTCMLHGLGNLSLGIFLDKESK